MLSSTAKVIADTVGVIPEARITTFEIYAPRYILAEINTHRVIAKSAQSSRAIPVRRRIEMVRNDPYIPPAFGRNRPGMQSTEALDMPADRHARFSWLAAMSHSIREAESLDAIGVHKQQANRLLEPFTYFYGVLTSTEWDNFWHLRRNPEADPGFEDLANKMFAAYQASTPREANYHLPYAWDMIGDLYDLPVEQRFKVSAARCARVSYKTFEGKLSTIEDDVGLCDKLLAQPHLSPFDHPATCDTLVTHRKAHGNESYWANPGDHRHFWGWKPYRVEIERERGIVCRRDSYAQVRQAD